MAVKVDLEGKVYLFKSGGSAPKLIVLAHGTYAHNAPDLRPDGRTFYFYGPHGKTLSPPLIEEVLSRAAHVVPLERHRASSVHDYNLTKAIDSHDRLKVNSTGSLLMDLDENDKTNSFHIASVRNRNFGWFGSGVLLLSTVVELAEKNNGRRYDEIHCLFCRVYKGQRLNVVGSSHTSYDNKALNKPRGGPEML